MPSIAVTRLASRRTHSTPSGAKLFACSSSASFIHLSPSRACISAAMSFTYSAGYASAGISISSPWGWRERVAMGPPDGSNLVPGCSPEYLPPTVAPADPRAHQSPTPSGTPRGVSLRRRAREAVLDRGGDLIANGYGHPRESGTASVRAPTSPLGSWVAKSRQVRSAARPYAITSVTRLTVKPSGPSRARIAPERTAPTAFAALHASAKKAFAPARSAGVNDESWKAFTVPLAPTGRTRAWGAGASRVGGGTGTAGVARSGTIERAAMVPPLATRARNTRASAGRAPRSDATGAARAPAIALDRNAAVVPSAIC